MRTKCLLYFLAQQQAIVLCNRQRFTFKRSLKSSFVAHTRKLSMGSILSYFWGETTVPQQPSQEMSGDLNTFLQNGATALKNKQAKHFHFVMGNEARFRAFYLLFKVDFFDLISDMDSMISSISYSFFLSKQFNSKEHVFFPVINIPRLEFD